MSAASISTSAAGERTQDLLPPPQHASILPQLRLSTSARRIRTIFDEEHTPISLLLVADIGAGQEEVLGSKEQAKTARQPDYPIRRHRAELVADAGHLRTVLADGNARANAIAETTLDEVRTAMGMRYA